MDGGGALTTLFGKEQCWCLLSEFNYAQATANNKCRCQEVLLDALFKELIVFFASLGFTASAVIYVGKICKKGSRPYFSLQR